MKAKPTLIKALKEEDAKYIYDLALKQGHSGGNSFITLGGDGVFEFYLDHDMPYRVSSRYSYLTPGPGYGGIMLTQHLKGIHTHFIFFILK